MILFTILLIIAITVAVVAICIIGAGGALTTILFSDLIVCVLLIGVLMYLIRKAKRK